MRFNPNARTAQEAKNYLANRSLQLLQDGFSLVSMDEYPWGIDATIYNSKENQSYQSLYILEQFRGQDLYLQKRNKFPIITSPMCELEPFLQKKNITYSLAGHTCLGSSYKIIEETYGDRIAIRSQQLLMNHIDEGLWVLEQFGCDENTKQAYALHPLVQEDNDLREFYSKTPEVNAKHLLLAMEYRRVANAYLSYREISSIKEIELSSLPEVNCMLIADKVQNYKDFLLYHKDTHPRREALDQYFRNWHERLNIPKHLVSQLTSLTVGYRKYHKLIIGDDCESA
jgi:hypothetical protein